ncbi:hypothetical protein EMPG_11367 [Blastomyces silverae]|uniref:BCD1 alpha/beta domain-containing protein n=1 Tax=Blastomyces silverae TaxID=2060906 RepID=A0A0H1BRH6_9EURO|nr:hypothetical protein EMPG_11367 [Blastomyces silverae]
MDDHAPEAASMNPNTNVPAARPQPAHSPACSGVRDPAAYLKRKELATPVAFDKDFNFLSGIERYVERAERDAENRGIELARVDGDGDDNGGDSWKRQRGKKPTEPVKKGEVGLLRGVEIAGVKMVRAPKGMSREQQNMSHWHKKHKCLNWTIEWILADDGRQTQKAISKCLESTSVVTAFSRTSLSKQIDAEINTTSPPAKKRKLDSETIPRPEPSVTQNTNTNTDININSLSSETHTATPCGQTPLSRTLSPETKSTPNPTQNSIDNADELTKPENETNAPTASIANGDSITNLPPNPPCIEPPSQQHKQHHFYLHRPQSRSKLPVLIPLTESVTITDALRNHSVLEFPTFYVLPWAAGELPADRFVLEEVYLRENGDGGSGDGLEEAVEEGEEGVEGGDVGNVLQGVDEKKVLEVLCKDLEVGG